MLRVATINTGEYTGADTHVFSKLVKGVQKGGFDILCCQDVPVGKSGQNNRAVELAEATGMACAFAVTGNRQESQIKKKACSSSGSAILTGTDCCMLSSGSFSLPGGSQRKKQKAQFAVVRKEGDAILVINLQLPRMKTSTEAQRREFQIIFEHPVMEKQYAAILLCGAFGSGTKGSDTGLFKTQSSMFQIHSADDCRNSSARICFVKSVEDPVADIDCFNVRQLLTSAGPVTDTARNYGAALDFNVIRREDEAVSQIYRYVSFIRPWNGPSEADQVSFQPAWMGQANAFGGVNTAGC